MSVPNAERHECARCGDKFDCVDHGEEKKSIYCGCYQAPGQEIAAGVVHNKLFFFCSSYCEAYDLTDDSDTDL